MRSPDDVIPPAAERTAEAQLVSRELAAIANGLQARLEVTAGKPVPFAVFLVPDGTVLFASNVDRAEIRRAIEALFQSWDRAAGVASPLLDS